MSTEDDYTNGMSSTKEYEPRTCCVATMKIQTEMYTLVDDSNAPAWPKSTFVNCCKLFFFLRVLQRCPRHCRSAGTKELHKTQVAYIAPYLSYICGKQVNGIYALCRNTSSVTYDAHML